MAHEVEQLFYVGNEVPWHGLGKKLETPPTSEEAIIYAGLDWEVYKEQAQSGGEDVEGNFGIRRETDKQFYGFVKENWTPLQNVDAFKFFDPIVNAGLAEYHTAGSLRNGEQVWILAKILSEPMQVVAGDTVDKFLLLSNGHTGKRGVNVQFCPIRTVCMNTLTAAEASNKNYVRIVHSTKVVQALENVRDIIDVANRAFDITLEKYKKLANMGVYNIEQFVTSVFYPKKLDLLTNNEDEVSRTVGKVISLFKNDPTNNLKGISGSMWSAYNAVTQYVDHARGRDDLRLNQAWFGQGKEIKSRAFDLALKLAA